MASDECFVDGGPELDDVIDEVTDIEIESEDDEGERILPVHGSELLLDTDTDKEIELFLRQELIPEKIVSEENLIETQHTNEQTCNTTEADHVDVTIPISEFNDTTSELADNPSAVKKYVPTETKGFQKQNGRTETLQNKQAPNNVEVEKQADNGVGFPVENVGASSLDSMQHSEGRSRSGDRTNQKMLSLRVKDADAEAKSVNEDKKTPRTETKSVMNPLWDKYVLAVKGLPPNGVQFLKDVLSGAVGINRHRISRKDDKIVHVHFMSLQDMRAAKETLNKQLVANHPLTVMETAVRQKQKFKGDHDEPFNKKMKGRDNVLQFYEETYEKQIELKMEKIHIKLRELGNVLTKHYSKYSSFVHKRRLQHGGLICALEKFKLCPPNERVVCICWFGIGLNKGTGQLALGIYEGGGFVRKLSSLKHCYPDHVVKTAEVFEELVRAQDNRTVWNTLVIFTNQVQDLMLLVFVDCRDDELKCVHDEIKRFFTYGEGKSCRVTSIYTRIMNKRNNKFGTSDLVMGAPFLEQTIAGLKLQLPPTKCLWNNVHEAEMMCKAVEELLMPSKKVTLLEVGYFSSIIGLYLSKVVGEVLSINAESAVEIAKKNAALNEITCCRYFGGKAEDMIPVVAKEGRYDKMCAVVTCCTYRSYATVEVMEQLRRIKHLDRLVLVEDKSVLPNCILALSRLNKDKRMGRPFFPVKAVPVEALNSKNYLLLILLERIDLDDMQQIGKFQVDDKPVSGSTERNMKARGPMKPREKRAKRSDLMMRQGHGHSLLNSVWETTALPQQSYDGLETGTGAGHDFLFQNKDLLSASHRHLQVAEEIERAYVGTVSNMSNVLDSYGLRELLIEEQKRKLEEECRRLLMEEQQRRWMVEEERRRQMEEARISQIQEEEWNRQIQMEDEWRRQVQEEEHRRQIQGEQMRHFGEEEWRRQIQEEEQLRWVKEEERRRQIEEEENRRQIHEEQMRQVEEEEQRQIQEEIQRRQILEEEQMRQVEGEERRRRIQEEKQRRQIVEEQMRQNQEESWKRQMQRETQRRSILEVMSRKQLEEEELGRRKGKEKKGGMVRTSSNLRTGTVVVEDIIASSLREADIPQPSAETVHKLKQLIVEAIRSAGVVNQEERQSVVSASSGVSGIRLNDVAVSHFGRSEKEIPEPRHFEEGDMYYDREVDSVYQRGYDAYGHAVGRHSYDDLKYCSVSRNQEINSESRSKMPSLLDLKLKPFPELSAASNDGQHPEGMGSCLDVSTNQRQGRMLTAQKELDFHTKLNHQSDRLLRDGKFKFSSVAEQNSDLYMRRSDLDKKARKTQSMWVTNSRYQEGRQNHSRRNHLGIGSSHLTTQW